MNTQVHVAKFHREVQEVFASYLDRHMRQHAQNFIQNALECLRDQALAAAWNQRTDQRQDQRNGYYGRTLSTLYGPLDLRVPRCRSVPLDSWIIFDRYQRRMNDVDRVLRHAYLLGASTRGDAELAEQIFGGSLSPQSISNLLKNLDDDLAAYRQQPVTDCYPVVYIDGMYVHMLGQERTVVMIVLGAKEDGSKDVLGFCVGPGESCADLLKDLQDRGLKTVRLFVSDDSGPIRSAIAEHYPEVPWQYCAVHRLADLRKKIGEQPYRDQMVEEASCIFRCPSKPAAVDTAVAWAKRWKDTAPYAVQCFLENLSDSLSFYELPKTWWRRIRTNNPLERMIRTLRIRLRPMNCFANVPAVERAVFGQLARWHLLPELTQSS
jgi:transposase-like protein